MFVVFRTLYERQMYPPTSIKDPMGKQSKRESLWRMQVSQNSATVGIRYRMVKTIAAAREGL
jgi:hypothetical protein